MPEAAVYKLMTDDATVAALVGTRIYPAIAPQSTVTPYIVYQRIATQHLHTMDGIAGLAETTIQIDCYASTYGAVKALADAVRLALDGYTGTPVGDGTVIGGILLDNTNDNPESPQTGLETILQRVSMDFTIWYEESTS